MTTFFIDLWQDLREKRLWPVAVGLLAAIVAVPVILFKPASDAAPPVTVTPPKGAAGTLPVVTVVSGPTEGSRLEAFNQKNPFKPMKDLAKTSSDTGPALGAAKASTASSGSTASGGPVLGGSSASGGSSNAGSTPSSSGSTTPGATPPTSGTTVSTEWFHYVADFSFGEPGAPKQFKSAASFTLLPDDANPRVTFIGVGDDHKSAVFFIADPSLQAAGEGKCSPKGLDCRFVTLTLTKTGDQESFTAIDGSVTYDLKLDAVKREKLLTDKSGNPKAPKSAKGIGATGAGVATTAQASESVLPSVVASGASVALEQK